MATTNTAQAASPYSLLCQAAGNGGDLAIDKATVYQHLHNLAVAGGPLEAYLRSVGDWTTFNLGGSRCGKIHVREVINRVLDAPGPTTFEFFWTATGFKVNSNGYCQYEIRLQHSLRA